MVTDSTTIDAPETISPAKVQALRLLNPWIAGDRRKLEVELRQWRERTSTLDRGLPDADGPEDLLLCLVQQMLDEPDLFAPRAEKMHLGVWVDLLTHLAHPELSDCGPAFA